MRRVVRALVVCRRGHPRLSERVSGALPARLSGVVFDCDGLLLDTETCWSRAEASLFADYEFGFWPTWRIISPRSMPDAALEAAGLARYFEVSGAERFVQDAAVPSGKTARRE